MLAVSTAEAVRARLKPLIDSHAYWTMLLTPAAFEIACDVERRFYQGPASADFHLSLGPLAGELVAVVVCAKTRMSSKSFLKLLRKHGGIPRKGYQLGEQDILIPDFGDEAKVRALVSSFYLWLSGLHPENN